VKFIVSSGLAPVFLDIQRVRTENITIKHSHYGWGQQYKNEKIE
jgi:hypothetical protein